MTMHVALRSLIAPVVMASFCPSALAQLIEDVELRRDGANAVINVRFVTGIQFQRVTTARAGDLAQVYYTVLPTRAALNFQGSQRRVPDVGSIPEITVTDETVSRTQLNRKLIVRLGNKTAFRVRAGNGNRSIEIVLTGLGDSVRLSTTQSPSAALAPGQSYIVTLQSSADPGHFLPSSVPARLQQYQTFTSRRTVDGRTLYDINIGYFGTLREANSALALLKSRFPQATVVALQAPAGTEIGPGNTPAEVEAKAAELMAAAVKGNDDGNFAASLEALGLLLNLPPNTSSRKAQEMIGTARLKLGDPDRARAEFEAFLNLYPEGADSDRVRQLQASLPPPGQALEARSEAPPSSWSGSVSMYYFGGQSRERSQEFEDSPISGLPELVSDSSISDADQGQLQTSVDLNWRNRTAESDSRFVFRNSYTANFERPEKSKNRLSAFYYDRKSLTNGTHFRLGRQSPLGGGVLYRFDGAQAGYTFQPKWRINAVAGAPADDLLQTQRRLYGAWIDAEALTDKISGSFYFNQQTIDSQVDRRAVGTELRYFSGGVSITSQFDYDTIIKALNIVSVQGTWQRPDTTVYNFLYDKRTTPILSLGNILFFQDPNLPQVDRVDGLLANNTVQQLREQVRGVTAEQTQFLLGVTTPLAPNWQIGGDIRYTNVGAVPAVPAINFPAQPSTGNLWGVGGQLIGTNLYSQSDTHVFLGTMLSGPSYSGYLLSYNNATSMGDGWRLEPSLRYYQQKDDTGIRLKRWTPGVRLTYRMKQASLESELSYERTHKTGPTIDESSDRLFYYLGARYDF